nr:hypothetical protein [Nocardia arthritidis]
MPACQPGGQQLLDGHVTEFGQPQPVSDERCVLTEFGPRLAAPQRQRCLESPFGTTEFALGLYFPPLPVGLFRMLIATLAAAERWREKFLLTRYPDYRRLLRALGR